MTPSANLDNNWIVPESSAQDDRSYAIYKTSSGLTCLLVSDPTTDKASAAMDVRVGHFSDPDSIPGLAHFLEHMLFMGTEKYPDENEYNEFLNSHGGSSNAYTDMESTNYYFDVGASHLEGALDRFAQFFIAPLFTESATQRELQAVESEHAKDQPNDDWRQLQLQKSLCKPSHPFHKFGSGNLETLKTIPEQEGIDVRQALLDFHKNHYSSNRSKLVVLGKESLEELKSMVEKCFHNMENKNLIPNKFDSTPYGPEQLCQRISVVAVSDSVRVIDMEFPLRETKSLYRSKPMLYISHLLGHEGHGSILSLLKEKGWANDLSAGESHDCTDWSSFSVTIEVTDEGLEHADDVIEIVFAYLNIIRQTGPQKWIHDETANVADCKFRFLNKRQPIDYTTALAGSMQYFPPEHVLSGPYRIYDYEPQIISECLEYLNPSNLLLMIIDKSLEGKTTLTEKWYGTQYSQQPLDSDLVARWQNASLDSELIGGASNLHLPLPNQLIASHFELRQTPVDAPNDEPRLYIDTDRCRLWYKPDNVFNMPKISVMALLKTNLPERSIKDSVLCLVWVQLLQELCTEFTYDASMASLNSMFVNSRLGMEVHVSGFSHKLHILIEMIVIEMATLATNVSQELLDRILDKVEKQCLQFLFSKPYKHAKYAVDLTLENARFPVHDKMRVLDEITLEDIAIFSNDLLGSHKLEILVHGNATPDEAKALAETFLLGLAPNAPVTLPERRVVELTPGHTFVYRFKEFNPQETNSGLAILYQLGVVDLATNATLCFLNHVIQEPAFNDLRTQEQLGYIVYTDLKTSGNDVKGLMFLIQSDSHDPIYCDSRVEAFLERFRVELLEMPEEEFEDNREAVVEYLLEKNKNMGEESFRYWDVITNESYQFKRYAQIADVVEHHLTKETVLELYDKYINQSGSLRRKLSVQVFSVQHEPSIENPVAAENITLIAADSFAEFRESMPLYPATPTVDLAAFLPSTESRNL